MDQFIKYCRQFGHDNQQVMYICTYPTCKTLRFACSDCLLQELHRHGQDNNIHILNQNMFIQKVQRDIDIIKQKQQVYQNKYMDLISNIKIHIEEIFLQLKKLQNLLNDIEVSPIMKCDMCQLDEFVTKVQSNNFNLLDDQTLNNLMDIDKYQLDEPIQQLISQYSAQIIENTFHISKWGESFINKKSKSQLINEANYEIIKIEELENKYIYAAAISNDSKYIVSGGNENILKIWNYYELIHQIQLKNEIQICQFTKDNKYIYVGLKGGTILQFDVTNNFSIVFNQPIHKIDILYLQCISSTVILTTSSDKSLIKTDTLTKQSLFTLQSPKKIESFDYDELRDLLATCSEDLSIKIYNNRTVVLKKENIQNNINIIKLNAKNNQLISLDNKDCVKLWTFDLKKKEIKVEKSIKETNPIYNIQLVQDQSFILTVCSLYSKIFSTSGELIRTLAHTISNFCINLKQQKLHIRASSQIHYKQFQQKENSSYMYAEQFSHNELQQNHHIILISSIIGHFDIQKTNAILIHILLISLNIILINQKFSTYERNSQNLPQQLQPFQRQTQNQMGCSINKNKASSEKPESCLSLATKKLPCACLQRIFERRLIFQQRSLQSTESQQREPIKNHSQILHDPPSSSQTVRNENNDCCTTNRERLKSVLRNSKRDKSLSTMVSQRVTFE